MHITRNGVAIGGKEISNTPQGQASAVARAIGRRSEVGAGRENVREAGDPDHTPLRTRIHGMVALLFQCTDVPGLIHRGRSRMRSLYGLALLQNGSTSSSIAPSD